MHGVVLRSLIKRNHDIEARGRCKVPEILSACVEGNAGGTPALLVRELSKITGDTTKEKEVGLDIPEGCFI